MAAVRGMRRLVPAAAEFHAEMQLAVTLADLVDGDDVRMIEPGSRFTFRSKALHIGSRLPEGWADHLECDAPIGYPPPRPVDDAHPAPSNFFEHFTRPESTEVSVAVGDLGGIESDRHGRCIFQGHSGVSSLSSPHSRTMPR